MENEKASYIMGFIPTGRANAIHIQELAARANMTAATAKEWIRQARKNHVILSAQCGYWLPESDAEGAAWVSMMEKQAKSRFVTMKHTRQQLRKDHNQLSLDDVGVV